MDLLRRTTAALAGKPGATLHVAETYPGPDDLWIADARGRHASEFLVQMEGPAPPLRRPPAPEAGLPQS